ncbi:diacylglycerol kinase family lipid kinase [Corynebacterium testudinoris]|uniref:Sphingosine/diacylglycerol kinase-like enzyme n=1 Tax=Corynebacterium testudinoris TaxID=136857 RepID=A0A0G3HA83_9CORY|nr:diacylglycerol kinase family protein [Corynebacterium testudinoris]AKK09645.1 sphingosine/diacylglycerol kinase-like enzyme [Corynebacterium testudinoris]MBX8996349.1 diacylglycerol kinase family lipid kinase [Corynebacterium testudinoris]
MRVLLIMNPNSTSQTDGLFRRIIPALRSVPGLRLRGVFTHHAGHAEEICRGLTRADWDLVLAVGGDGTVNEVINGLLGPAGADTPSPQSLPAVAVIPTGSANVFARALGFPSEPVAATTMLVQLLREDLRRTIYLGTWNDRWFAVNAGFGIDADVIARVDEARRLGFAATPLRYLNAATMVWIRARRTPPRIDVVGTDAAGQRLNLSELPLFVASNTNPWTFLGPLPVVTNPRNSFELGLGLFGLTDTSGVRGILSMLHLVGFGHRPVIEDWLEKRTVQFDDVTQVTLSCPTKARFQADGEYVGEFQRADLASHADALEVFAPREAYPVSSRTWRRVLRDFIRVH